VESSDDATTHDVPRSQQLSIDEQERLVDAVTNLECVRDSTKRQLVVTAVQRHVGPKFDPERFTDVRSDIYSIIDACLATDSVLTFLKVAKMIGGMTDRWSTLNQVVADIFQRDIVLAKEFAAIQDHLKTLSRRTLKIILASALLERRVELTSLSPPDAIGAFRAFEVAASEAGAEIGLLIFLELVAHQLQGRGPVVLHQTVDEIARRRGLTARIAQICRSLFLEEGSRDAPERAPSSIDLSGNDDNVSDSAVMEPVDGPGEEDQVKSTSTHPGATDPVVGVVAPAVWGGVPPRNKHFTGRADLLDEIRRLLRHRTQAAVLPQTLFGLGGVGKTQLAVEYIYRNQGDYELIWWIPADDDRLIRRSFASLAKRLRLLESRDVQHTVDTVLEELRLGQPTANWLLIFDNAADPVSLRPYLPPGPGHTLITSRNQDWITAGSTVGVDVFAEEESLALLRKRWPDLTTAEALILAQRLGHLPLALEQAVALHEQTGMPLAEYLRNLGDSPGKLLEETVPGAYPHSVADTFRLGYEQLKGRSLAAAQLLEVCAFLSSHPISIQMLIRGRAADLPEPLRATLRDDILMRRAVRTLGQYALGQLDPGRELITIHMLIRAVLRDGLSAEECAIMEGAAHAVLAIANPGQPDNPATWSQHAQIFPHIDASGIIFSDSSDARQTVLDQIRYLYVIGDYAASQTLAKLVVQNWRARLGHDDPMTLVASRRWADALRALGDRVSARKVNEETLNHMRTVLGEEHEHTLATANGYGADLRLLGKFAEARALDERNFASYRAVLGEDDPATLRSENSLALDERLLGRFEESRAIQQDLRDRCLNVLGEENPQTLLAYSNLARDLYGLGYYREGLDLQAEKLPVFKSKLGPGHAWVLLAQRYYAILLRKCGEYSQALEQAEQNYSDCLLYFRRTHDLTLAATVTLCNALRVSGDPEQASSFGQEALDAYSEGFGRLHPFTLACATDFAITLRALGKHADATALDDATYAGLAATLGERHPHTLCSASGRATNLATSGQPAEALALSQQVYDLSAEVRRLDHPVTLACAANLALDLAAAGDHAKAAELKRETNKRMRLQLGNEHPEIVNVERGRRAECDIEIPTT
jgi:hypothetical protein